MEALRIPSSVVPAVDSLTRVREVRIRRQLRVLIIDNYDSFTYNLHQALAELTGEDPLVVPNNSSWSDIQCLLRDGAVDCVVLSPGPGTPDRPQDVGICAHALTDPLMRDIPVLGVCLGLQLLVVRHGGSVQKAAFPMHGRVSRVTHVGAGSSSPRGLFSGVRQGFAAIRYNSLVASLPLPPSLELTAWTQSPGTQTTEVMAVRSRQRPVFAVQFHPESIASEDGVQLLRNFCDIAWQHRIARLGDTRPSHVHLQHLSSKRSLADEHKQSPEDGAVWSRLAAALTGTERNHVTGCRMMAREMPWIDPEMCGAELDKSSSVLTAARRLFAAVFRQHNRCFWLDSSKVERGRSRYSYMGGHGGPLQYSIQFDAARRAVHLLRSDQSSLELLFKDSAEDLFSVLTNLMQLRPVGDFTYVSSPGSPVFLRCSKPFPFVGGLVGYLGYECKSESLSVPTQIHTNRYMSPHADAAFMFADRFVAFDHELHRCWLVCLEHRPSPRNTRDNGSGTARCTSASSSWMSEMLAAAQRVRVPSSLAPEAKCTANEPHDAMHDVHFRHSEPEYLKLVESCLRHIVDGESYELCLTNQIRAAAVAAVDPFKLYRHLRRINPAPYAAFLSFSDVTRGGVPTAVACSSPERFMQASSSGWVESKPIKGTLSRGKTTQEDARLARQLSTSGKDFSENLMIVDLIRNDLAKVCRPGTVHVPAFMAVESYATVHQLVSTVRGHLRPEVHAVDCVKAAFPPGSMTGAPKLRSVQLLEALEAGPRGIYSGTLGFLSADGGLDLNVVIRTAVISGGQLTIGTGGAIVYQSSPTAEHEEMLLKARPLLRAVHAVRSAL